MCRRPLEGGTAKSLPSPWLVRTTQRHTQRNPHCFSSLAPYRGMIPREWFFSLKRIKTHCLTKGFVLWSSPESLLTFVVPLLAKSTHCLPLKSSRNSQNSVFMSFQRQPAVAAPFFNIMYILKGENETKNITL